MNTTKFLADQKRNNQESQARTQRTTSQIPFLKLEEGKHRIRFIPKGNVEEDIPYKSVRSHRIPITTQQGQRTIVYALCYDWLFGHENAKEATIQPLIKMGKLKPEDIKRFQDTGGCPVCRAATLFTKGGEKKELIQPLYAGGMNYWNVLNRADKKIYVMSISNEHHRKITSTIALALDADDSGVPGEDAMDILDPETGYDWQCNATGQNSGRRYAYDVITKAKPIGEIMEGEKPTNLMLAVAETFKSYEEMCLMLRRLHGPLLASYNFDYGIGMAAPSPSLKAGNAEMRAERKKEAKIKERMKPSWDDLDNPYDEDEKENPADKATNPKSIDWDEEDEDNPKPKKKKSSNDLKATKSVTKSKPVAGSWEDLISDDDEDEDVEMEGSDLVVNGVKMF